MLEKKLTALGCAAGIILFGACYGGTPNPSPPPSSPPPALLGIDANRLHNMRVTAINTSTSSSLSSDEVARAVARRWHAEHTGIGVYLEGAPHKGGESILTVAVLSEEALPLPRASSTRVEIGSAPVVLVARVSAVLTDKKGDVIWRESATDYSTSCNVASPDGMNAWKLPACQASVEETIATQLVTRLISVLEK